MMTLKERFFTPAHDVLDALPTGASYGFGRKEYGAYVSVPMKSGRRALYRNHSYTPLDPGDQHIYKFVFVKYLKDKSCPTT